MLRFKNLNNISEKLEKDIPKLEKGQEVVFQMLNGHPNNDNDRGERERNPILYGKTQLSTKLRIKDPYTNSTVEIGAPMAVEGDIVTSYRPFLAGLDDGVFKGKFSLFGGNSIHEELFEVFWLSPEREGSPCADSRIKPVFKIVNNREESQKTISKIDTLRKALDVLKAMEEADYRDFAASQNWGETDLADIQAKVGDFAKSNPDKFLTIKDDPDTKIKSTLKRALDKNIITYDAITGDVLTGDSVIMRVAKDKKPEYLSAIAVWIKSAKNGKQVLDGIEKQLGAEV